MSSIKWENIDNGMVWEDLSDAPRTTHLYDVLEVEPDARFDEIRHAYHRLALIHHPDRNPPENKDSSEERMKSINGAYKILSNPATRHEYDKTGSFSNG